MASQTVHVYPFDGAWAVKQGVARADIFVTKREAIAAAVRAGRKAQPAQIAVHGKDGRILEQRTYGIPKVQGPPKRGHLASSRIAKAVAKVVMKRIYADPLPPRYHSRAK